MTKKKPTFEQALEKLEEIVSGIEEGDVPLEESIDKYAEGIKLIKQCREILDTAEQKIQLLSKNQDGTLETEGQVEVQEQQ